MSAPDPMTAPSIKWGILGAGGIAAKFADAVKDYTSSSVVAVASASSLEKAQDFAKAHDAGDAYQSYEELVAREDVDAVYVATTHNNHHEPAILAIQAGKHVLVEKSFAQNSIQTEAILAAAEEAGVFVMEAMWTRHLPHVYELRSAIAAGEIGEVTCVIADHGQQLTHVPRMASCRPRGRRAARPGRVPDLVRAHVPGRARHRSPRWVSSRMAAWTTRSR